MINLGDEVRDEVSGFKGVVLARMECLYEATALRIHPLSYENGQLTYTWVEEDRCVVVKERTLVGFVDVAGKRQKQEAKA